MTPREKALLLRLAAIEETGEWGAHNLRRTLYDLGWDDTGIDAVVLRVRKAVSTLQQARLFDVAA